MKAPTLRNAAAPMAGKLPAGDGATRQAGPMAAASVVELQDRMRFELQPLLQAVELLANSLRMMRTVRAAAELSPGFRDDLARWCPEWADPLNGGGNSAPDAVLHDLARLAADVGHELCGMTAQGGAA